MTGRDLEWRWFETKGLSASAKEIAECAGLWVVPGSPYANMDGVLAVIRRARESGQPFLGTCGGFQHALIEFARDVVGLAGADHAESAPDAEILLVTRLECSLVEKTSVVRFLPRSRLRAVYGADEATEGYRCNYGLNLEYRQALEGAGMRFSAFDVERKGDLSRSGTAQSSFFRGNSFPAGTRGATRRIAAAG